MDRHPFKFGKLAIGVHFTNREKERKRLRANITSGVNTILISPRRYGKSSLVQQVAEEMGKDRRTRFAQVDLFEVRNEREMLERITSAVISATSSTLEDRLRDLKRFVQTIVPQVGIGSDPTQELTVGLSWEDVERSRHELLELPEKLAKAKKIQLVLCIDEFQNIGHFPDPKATQKLLRAAWQRQQHVTHLLYGSKRHMMLDIFTKSNMPFYKFGDLLFLERIARPDWVKYITDRFRKTKKKIGPALANAIAGTMEDHPYSVQMLANATWQHTSGTATQAALDQGLEDLMDQYTILYQRIVDDLTTPQLRYLEAMSDGVERFTTSEVLARYEFGSSALVGRIRTALEKKDILDHQGTHTIWLDPLFRLWLENRFWHKPKRQFLS
ncbi:MAG: ATP-binding protein [Flavobacteriales bacterium]|nr:ATP-binding protein [Flavobacteriales bacterium]